MYQALFWLREWYLHYLLIYPHWPSLRDLDGCSSSGGHFDPMISPGVLQAFHFENWINCTWDPISCWTVWVSCASALLLVLLWNTRPFRIRLIMPLCGAGYAISSRSTVRGEQWRYGAASVKPAILRGLGLPGLARHLQTMIRTGLKKNMST